ncbi:hypothetical protein AHiyo4_31140 [Arthrobacter sp. Hiyo4]|nr:hypothetical protein AHiyo4_31140 [Arthrobacter sp. Hiyo4]
MQGNFGFIRDGFGGNVGRVGDYDVEGSVKFRQRVAEVPQHQLDAQGRQVPGRPRVRERTVFHGVDFGAGTSWAMEPAIAPEPVPRSTIRGCALPLTWSMTSCTTDSVSGRG